MVNVTVIDKRPWKTAIMNIFFKCKYEVTAYLHKLLSLL